MSGSSNGDRLSRRRAATADEILQAAWTIARERGLSALSMRDLGAAVGMRAQSLYQYFASKQDIYDAMFAEGYRAALAALRPFEDDFDAAIGDADAQLTALHRSTRTFFDFCVSDAARYELLFQHRVPGFEPSPASYSVALELFERFAMRLASLGLDDDGVDIMVAVLEGLAGQQIANDPGGHRWSALLPGAVDMVVDRHAPQLRRRSGRRRCR